MRARTGLPLQDINDRTVRTGQIERGTIVRGLSEQISNDRTVPYGTFRSDITAIIEYINPGRTNSSALTEQRG
jgi:hypothetical protein